MYDLDDIKILNSLSEKFNIKKKNLHENIVFNKNSKFIKLFNKKYFNLLNKIENYEIINKRNYIIIEVKINYTKLDISKDKTKKIANEIPIIWKNLNLQKLHNPKHEIMDFPNHSLYIENLLGKERFYQQFFDDVRIYKIYINNKKNTFLQE